MSRYKKFYLLISLLIILVLLLYVLQYCQVVRAKKKDTGMVYALKIMDKKFITKENKTAYVKLERIVLDQLDHPGIVRLYFTFQDTFSLCRSCWFCLFGILFLLHVLHVSFIFCCVVLSFLFFSWARLFCRLMTFHLIL